MGYMSVGNEIIVMNLATNVLEFKGRIADIKPEPNKCQYTVFIDDGFDEHNVGCVTYTIPLRDYSVLDTTGSFLKDDWSIEISHIGEVPGSCGCKHVGKRKVQMITSSYWFCPDCKSDLGNL